MHKVEELLPFYVNGSLSAAEKAEVERHLDADPNLREEVAFLTQLRTTIKDAPGAQPPGELGLKRLQKSLKRETAESDLFSRLLAGRAAEQDNRVWKMMAVAACLLLMVQTGVMVRQYLPSDDLTAASGAAQADLSAIFVPGATEAEIRRLLTDLHVTIVDGPSALGVYHLRVEGDVDKVMQVMQAQEDVVESVQRANP